MKIDLRAVESHLNHQLQKTAQAIQAIEKQAFLKSEQETFLRTAVDKILNIENEKRSKRKPDLFKWSRI